MSDRVGLVLAPEARIYDHGPEHPLRPDRVLTSVAPAKVTDGGLMPGPSPPRFDSGTHAAAATPIKKMPSSVFTARQLNLICRIQTTGAIAPSGARGTARSP